MIGQQGTTEDDSRSSSTQTQHSTPSIGTRKEAREPRMSNFVDLLLWFHPEEGSSCGSSSGPVLAPRPVECVCAVSIVRKYEMSILCPRPARPPASALRQTVLPSPNCTGFLKIGRGCCCIAVGVCRAKRTNKYHTLIGHLLCG